MKNGLLKWTLPVGMLLVICLQFYKVFSDQLTRWKGGGYGMYTEVHPQERQVWVQWGDSVKQVNTATGHSIQWHRKAVLLCYRPNAEKMKKFARDYARAHHLSSVKIQVWKPQVDARYNTLSRTLINEISYAAER